MASVPYWYHSIDLGRDVVTPGRLGTSELADLVGGLHLPDLQGKRVLDIGTWDGYFAFMAEDLGAAEVVALDRFVWELDLPGYMSHYETSRREGRDVVGEDVERFRDPGRLPGKAGFDAARRALGSGVRPMVAEFTTVAPSELGSFDVVFFLGVLYHLTDPFGALRKLAALTDDVAIIETALVHVPGMEDQSLAEFWGGSEYGGDPTNWWGLSLAALESMCGAAGFAEVRLVDTRGHDHTRMGVYRGSLHAHKKAGAESCPCASVGTGLESSAEERTAPRRSRFRRRGAPQGRQP